MDKESFTFNATNSAISELNKALSKLEVVLKEKPSNTKAMKDKYKKELEVSDKKLNNLKSSTQKVMSNIDDIIKKLDKVFEENGTNNNKN